MKLVISGTTPSQKNSKQIFRNARTGAPFITSSSQAKAWHKAAGFELAVQWQHKEPLAGPLGLTVVFYRDTARKYDLDNAYSTVADALKHAGVIADDNMTVIECVTLQHGGVDKQCPRAEIYLDE